MHDLLKTRTSLSQRAVTVGMLCALLIGSRAASAQQVAYRFYENGTSDLSFGPQTGSLNDNGVSINAGARDTQNRIVLAGRDYLNGRFIVVRLTAEGTIDPTFGGGDGTVYTDFPGDAAAKDVAIRSDGTILAAGFYNDGGFGFAVACYTASGNPCVGWGTLARGWGRTVTSFPTDTYATAIAAAPDGSFVVAGYTHNPGRMVLAGYLSNGHPNPAFGDDGVTIVGPFDTAILQDVAINSSGAIFAVGAVGSSPPDMRLAVMRFGPNGQLSAKFGASKFDNDGIFTPFPGDCAGVQFHCWSTATAVALDDEGRLMVGGYKQVGKSGPAYPLLLRMLPTGHMDHDFGDAGWVFPALPETRSKVRAVTVSATANAIWIAGDAGDTEFPSLTWVGHLTSAGLMDATFGGDGLVMCDPQHPVAKSILEQHVNLPDFNDTSSKPVLIGDFGEYISCY